MSGTASRRQVEEANLFERDLFGNSAQARGPLPLPAYGVRSAWRGGAVREETIAGLEKRLTHFSFFPHRTRGGTAVRMTPAEMDPGYYKPDGTYSLAGSLQPQLNALVGRAPFTGSRVALVDLTKDRDAPEFAGVRHMQQVFIASVIKIAALFAAFQLQQDIRALARRPTPTGGGVFDWVRDLWADTQFDHGGASVPFTKDIALRGRLVLVNGKKVPLIDPRAPRLDTVFAAEAKPFAFASTPKTRAELSTAITEFTRIGKPAIDALAFMQRMMVVGGGLVPASNFAATTVVRDLGFPVHRLGADAVRPLRPRPWGWVVVQL